MNSGCWLATAAHRGLCGSVCHKHNAEWPVAQPVNHRTGAGCVPVAARVLVSGLGQIRASVRTCSQPAHQIGSACDVARCQVWGSYVIHMHASTLGVQSERVCTVSSAGQYTSHTGLVKQVWTGEGTRSCIVSGDCLLPWIDGCPMPHVK